VEKEVREKKSRHQIKDFAGQSSELRQRLNPFADMDYTKNHQELKAACRPDNALSV